MTIDDTFDTLYSEIRDLIQSSRTIAVRNVNRIQVFVNFEIGRRIVEYEQGGAATAEYGKMVVKRLAERLRQQHGRGFSYRNLWLFRKFYLTYRARIPTPSFAGSETVQTVSAFLPENINPGAAAPDSMPGWSHYVVLMTVKDAEARSFYEIEALRGNWTVRELERQIESALYERLALSLDKNEVKRLAHCGQMIEKPDDAFKDPYILEFLNLDEKAAYTESDLESAIIDKLEHFLLELGKGFLFEARQRRFTFDNDHFYVDLVFYNRLLRCYVLLDLKVGKLAHQDLGQMQMYVNYFDRYVKLAEENPTVGIILCRQKNDALVEITLPEGSNIRAAEYQTYLPDREELRRRLIEWQAEPIQNTGR